MDLTVKFIVAATGKVVEKHFDSYYFCRKFVLRARHSKKIKLVSYPNISR